VDIGVEDFCSVCKKCAQTCPSNSIKHGEIGESDGFIRWKHNGKTCGERWLETGTDCAICMRVCPWSHARTFPHKLIVGMVSRNKYARRLFKLMDDIFYGKNPKPKKGPHWARYYSE
jgi:epoxyqueuosine reductase QueG